MFQTLQLQVQNYSKIMDYPLPHEYLRITGAKIIKSKLTD